MDRTTYWGYSLSWYNLARERAKWWDQIKRKGERKGQKEREERIKEKRKTFYILQSTFCRQPSIALGPPSGDRLWVRITLFLHQSHHPSLLPPNNLKHSRRQDLIIFMEIIYTKWSIVSLWLHFKIFTCDYRDKIKMKTVYCTWNFQVLSGWSTVLKYWTSKI